MGYTKDTIKGISWMGALRVFIRGLGFIRIAILARILTPQQFGVFGIAALILSFLEISTETGINVFLIQTKEKIDSYINSAWIISIARGLIISIILFSTRTFVINFFNVQTAGNLLLLICIVPLIRGFINPSIIKFRKDLLFNKEFILQFIIYASDALTVIITAIITHSAMSLVWGLVVSSFLEVIVSFIFVKPRPIFLFNIKKAKRIISRGKWVTGYGFFDFLYQNLDDAVVGKILGTYPLGIYQVAYKISSLPMSEVSSVFVTVTLPIYSKFSLDKQRLKRAFLKTIFVTSILMISIGLIVFVFPHQLVLIILGSEWLSAVGVLKILALFGVFKGLTGVMQSLFLAVEKQEYVTFVTIVTLFGLIITILPFVRHFGIIGAGLSAVVGSILGFILSIYYTYKLLYEKIS